MVVEKTKCKCGMEIRANGSSAFEDALLNHFRIKHDQEYINLKKLQEDANQEFTELKEKYPELMFAFSFFRIDYRILIKTQTPPLGEATQNTG